MNEPIISRAAIRVSAHAAHREGRTECPYPHGSEAYKAWHDALDDLVIERKARGHFQTRRVIGQGERP